MNIEQHNTRVLSQSLRSIRPINIGVATICAARDFGARRNLPGILAVAGEWEADERIVAAMFGFLPQLFTGKYVDALCENEAPELDMTNGELVAAFNVARLAFGCHGRSMLIRNSEPKRLATGDKQRMQRIRAIIDRNRKSPAA